MTYTVFYFFHESLVCFLLYYILLNHGIELKEMKFPVNQAPTWSIIWAAKKSDSREGSRDDAAWDALPLLAGCKLTEARRYSAVTWGCASLLNTRWGLRVFCTGSTLQQDKLSNSGDMTTRSEREKAQKLNEQHQAILSKLLREEDNKYCADCEAKGECHTVCWYVRRNV